MDQKQVVVTGTPGMPEESYAASFAGPPLVITADDLEADVRNGLQAAARGDRLLGSEQTLQAVYDAIPGAIARRLQRMVRSEFRVAKITLQLQLDVKIPGVNVGGMVEVTLEPS